MRRARRNRQVAIELGSWRCMGVSTAENWINLQSAYDLAQARQTRVEGVQPLHAA
jgi:plasmid maintenance system antidote protein VapI